MTRPLTSGEIGILSQIFIGMLPYEKLQVGINSWELGGEDNSITPAGIPYMARKIYHEDYSQASIHDFWVFMHEHVHVWQYFHGDMVTVQGIGLVINTMGSGYHSAYPYVLEPGKTFGNYNFEQQASIVPDYWFTWIGQPPKKNVGPNRDYWDYMEVMGEFWSAGPPLPIYPGRA
ncbi:hypothetical protein GGE65_007058 [Skermanella aerolata]|uniref:hypothetical protein n=1 Tax=Skermanella aerolata TaxID=393310 RepID=UPI003D19CFE9